MVTAPSVYIYIYIVRHVWDDEYVLSNVQRSLSTIEHPTDFDRVTRASCVNDITELIGDTRGKEVLPDSAKRRQQHQQYYHIQHRHPAHNFRAPKFEDLTNTHLRIRGSSQTALTGPPLRQGALNLVKNEFNPSRLENWALHYGAIDKIGNKFATNKKNLTYAIGDSLNFSLRTRKWLRERCRLLRVCGSYLNGSKSDLVDAVNRLELSKRVGLSAEESPLALERVECNTLQWNHSETFLCSMVIVLKLRFCSVD